jgi:hypothetical protein
MKNTSGFASFPRCDEPPTIPSRKFAHQVLANVAAVDAMVALHRCFNPRAPTQ